jgi:hypothetical protein
MNLFWQAIAAIASAVTRPPALLLGSLLGFGILVPHRLGLTFADSRMLLAYAFLPMLFVAAPVALGMPRARESTQKLYTWLSAAVVFGVTLWATFFLLATLTMTIVTHPVRPPYPTLATFLTHALLCAASCWFSVTLSAYLSMLFSPSTARNALRILFLLILAWMQFGPSILSPRLRWYVSGISPAAIGATALLFAAGLTNALRAGVHANPAVNETSSVASQ